MHVACTVLLSYGPVDSQLQLDIVRVDLRRDESRQGTEVVLALGKAPGEPFILGLLLQVYIEWQVPRSVRSRAIKYPPTCFRAYSLVILLPDLPISTPSSSSWWI